MTLSLLKKKTRSIVKNVGRALVKKKMIMIGSKKIDSINNADIYDTYKDLYLIKKVREEKILHDIQLADGLRVRVSANKANKKSNNSYD